MNEKIFINIASFRDPTLGVTIKSALVNARNPENLVFGIGAQYYDGEMPSIHAETSQVKIINYHPDTRPGLVKIRYEISKMITDEKYFLMIDSHVLFNKDWDVTAKEYLQKFTKMSGHDRVLLSSINSNNKEFLKTKSFEFKFFEKDLEINGKKIIKDEILLIETNKKYKSEELSDFLLGYHVVCNGLFTYSNYLKDVGLDSKSHFLYEENYLSWKTYVSGWDNYDIYTTFLNQCDYAYFNIVWNSDVEKRTYYRPELEASDVDKADMASAMIFNKSKNFSAKNERRSPESFWKLIGQEEMFKYLKTSTRFKDLLVSLNLL
jgi:hypothetical protein